MGLLAAGQVVVLPFPFSDLSRNKYRPVLVLADACRGDWIACQITSNPYSDPRALALTEQDFANGRLAHTSYVRPGKFFTAHADLMEQIVGTVKPDFLGRAREAVIQVIRGRA
jgi:mRNA interferase MazF